jgi:hypothetical protein
VKKHTFYFNIVLVIAALTSMFCLHAASLTLAIPPSHEERAHNLNNAIASHQKDFLIAILEAKKVLKAGPDAIASYFSTLRSDLHHIAFKINRAQLYPQAPNLDDLAINNIVQFNVLNPFYGNITMLNFAHVPQGPNRRQIIQLIINCVAALIDFNSKIIPVLMITGLSDEGHVVISSSISKLIFMHNTSKALPRIVAPNLEMIIAIRNQFETLVTHGLEAEKLTLVSLTTNPLLSDERIKHLAYRLEPQCSVVN